MTAPQIALISDDLTGALDSAAPFAVLGWRTVVATGLAALERAMATGADVVAVSLNSREIEGAEAAGRAREAAEGLKSVPVVFKKIDSRMKGHVEAEAIEIAKVRGAVQIVLCPAIPELGRVVQDGFVCGHGIDRPIPVALPARRAIAIDTPDADGDAALDRIVAHSAGALLVGARGMAAALARWMGRPQSAAACAINLRRPITLVVGSRDLATVEQVKRLRLAEPSAHWIAAPDGLCPEILPDLPDVTILQAVAGAGAKGPEVAARLASTMAQSLVSGRRTLLLTGGETAAACLRAMNADLLQIMGEAQTGMPISLPLEFPGAPHIVTKSGGFGGPDCLITLVQALNTQGTR